MAELEVREALIQLEAAMEVGQPIGASELPDEIRFFRVLNNLRDIICPRVGTFIRAADGRGGDLVSIVADCIVSAVGAVPIPAATVAKHLVGIGFDRFCAAPAALLSGGDSLGGDDVTGHISGRGPHLDRNDASPSALATDGNRSDGCPAEG